MRTCLYRESISKWVATFFSANSANVFSSIGCTYIQRCRPRHPLPEGCIKAAVLEFLDIQVDTDLPQPDSTLHVQPSIIYRMAKTHDKQFTLYTITGGPNGWYADIHRIVTALI